MSLPKFKLILLVVFLLWCLPGAWAQQSKPEETGTGAAGDSGAAKSETPEAKKAVSPKQPKDEDGDSAAQPLGAWIRLKPREAEQTGKEAAPGIRSETEKAEIEEEKALFNKLLERRKPAQESSAPMAPVVSKAFLDKEQKSRLAHAEKVQRKVLKKQTMLLKKLAVNDKRGKPELRICTLNLNIYGTFKAVRSNTRRGAKNYLAREKAIVSLLAESGCNVVALQGLVGMNLADAEKGINRLAEKVTKHTSWRWTGYVGGSNNKEGFNGYLISNHNIRVEAGTSYVFDELVKLPGFGEDRFVRGPFEVVLRVRDSEHGIWHAVVLITMYFRKALDQIAVEPEGYRMQMAETLRRILEKRSQQYAEGNKPVIVLLGDRAEPRYAPAAQILEGALQLKDFRSGGPCEVKEIGQEAPGGEKNNGQQAAAAKKYSAKVKYVAACSTDLPHLKVLFGLSAETLVPVLVRSRMVKGAKKYDLVAPDERAEKLMRAEKRRQQSEIYLFEQDLHYAWAEPGSTGRYAVVAKKLRGGVKHSPLVAADLNW
jgi:hypothetical protein